MWVDLHDTLDLNLAQMYCLLVLLVNLVNLEYNAY